MREIPMECTDSELWINIFLHSFWIVNKYWSFNFVSSKLKINGKYDLLTNNFRCRWLYWENCDWLYLQSLWKRVPRPVQLQETCQGEAFWAGPGHLSTLLQNSVQEIHSGPYQEMHSSNINGMYRQWTASSIIYFVQSINEINSSPR